jgi:hypothetical protein
MAPNPPVQRAVQRAVNRPNANQPNANQPNANQPNANQPNANQPVVDYWDEVDNLHQDIINPVNAIINGDNYIIIPVQLFEDMHRFNINRRQAAILQAIQRQAAQPNIGN